MPYRTKAKISEPTEEPVKEEKHKDWKVPALLATACAVAIMWLIAWPHLRWCVGLTIITLGGWLTGIAIARSNEIWKRELEAKRSLETLLGLRSDYYYQYSVMERAADWIKNRIQADDRAEADRAAAHRRQRDNR